MFRPSTRPARHTPPVRGRRGAILVVVLGLLTLFAILGVAFVYTAGAEAEASRIAKDRENQNALVPPDATAAVNAFLGSLIFPVGDSNTDALNSLRGHELLRAMYGGRTGSNVPYNGVGTFHEDARNYGNAGISPATFPTTYVDRAHLVNHTASLVGGQRFLLDPEWTGMRPLDMTGAFVGPPVPGSGRGYVAKNAPYTYPDLKDLYLASVSPTTGEVLVKSFHRDWLFNAQNPNLRYRLAPWNPNDPLDPMNLNTGTHTATNTDWVSAEGRLKVLRPRPVDQLLPSELPAGFNPLPSGPAILAMPLAQQQSLYNVIRDNIANGTIIGYPQQNTDTSFTGDHVNLPGGAFGRGNADSIVIDAGLPVIPLSNGKIVKPVVSALIQDLNGRLNLSAHGNIQNSNSGAHNSYHGLGAWEVNLEKILGTGGQAVVADRRGAAYTTRAGVGARAFDGSGTRLPSYSFVDWQLTANGVAPTPPTLPPMPPPVVPGTHLETSLRYAAPPFEDNTTAFAHPSLFNPSEWPAGTVLNTTKTYPISNMRRMGMQYAPSPIDYLSMTFPGLPARNSGNAYRTSLSHPMLGLLTTRGSSLDRPGLMPNFTTIAGSGQALQMTSGALHPTYLPTYLTTFPNTSTAGVGGDFGAQAGNVNWSNTLAAIGPVDINRRLADYRDLTAAPNVDATGNPTPQPLSSTNVANQLAASSDRHNLAKDIFSRLVVATGAFSSATVGTLEYDALRYLAQLAVNIVDYIDSDDVSTAFVWNPVDPTNLTPFTDANNFTPTEVENRVVFGVEKPRLVLNEIYSEVVNNNAEPPPPGGGLPPPALTHPLQVRFWVELLNPTNTPYTGGTQGPLGDGGVTLLDGVNSVYQIAVRRITSAVDPALTALSLPSNVRGDLPAGGDSFICNFNMTQVLTDPNKQRVRPNNGQYNPSGVPAQGIALVGPPSPDNNPAINFAPVKANAPWTMLIESEPAGTPNLTMLYTQPGTTTDTNLGNSTYKRHVVQLRRLANPYVGFNPQTNPYITVDMADHVPAHDAVSRLSGNGTRQDKSMNATGYDAKSTRFSIGKIQPYASFAATATPAMGAQAYVPTMAQFATTFSAYLRQAPTVATGEQVPHTFGRHNGMGATEPTNSTYTPPAGMNPSVLNDTIIVPYDWYVHFDRPAISPLELLHVQGVKPHLVTQYTLQRPTAASQFQTTQGNPQWTTAGNGLYRAFEVLRTQDRTYGTPIGGKVHGRMNLNTIMHPDVLRALFDAQAGNGFSDAQVYDASGATDDFWRRLVCPPDSVTLVPGRPYRTVQVVQKTLPSGASVFVPAAGPSVHDIDPSFPPPNAPTTLDRPYLSFGAAQFSAPASGTTAFAAGSNMGLQDTVLRSDTTNGTPLIYAPSQSHPYFQAEPVRKIMNNLTTTSDTFAVTFTIAFHEVRMNGATQVTDSFGRNLLGKEVYKEVPGDLRQQFFTVIDRSQAGVPAGGTGVQSTPFFTTVEANPVGAVALNANQICVAATLVGGQVVAFADGVPVALQGTNITIGVGGNAEPSAIQVTSAAAPVMTNPMATPPAGIYVLTLQTNPTKLHAPGSCVSNFVPGHSGPTAVTVPSSGSSTFQALIPLFTRVR